MKTFHFRFLILFCITFALHSLIQAQNSHVFYWVTDKSGDTDNFLAKYNPTNHNNCKHYIARVNGISLQRGASVAFKTGTPNFDGLKSYYQGGGNMLIGMNSGLMNKSYEYADRTKWSNRFSGDIGVMDKAKAAGATRVVMFMQSPLSKGKSPTFDPEVKNENQPNGGATLDMRVADCFEYAEYIWANKPEGIEVTFGLIDAYPAKSPQPGDAFHAAYVKLAKGLQERGMLLEEIQFDMKTHTVKNNATKLLTAMERAYKEIKAETGTEVRMTWYTWYGSTKDEMGTINANVNTAFQNIANHAKRKYMTGLLLGGNSENRNGMTDLIPESIEEKRIITARMNEAYSILEKLGTMNPVNADDPIMPSKVVTSVENVASNLSFSLFPNPANDRLFINHPFQHAELSLINILGKTIFVSPLTDNNTEVDLSGIPTGIYFVSIRAIDKTFTQKILIE